MILRSDSNVLLPAIRQRKKGVVTANKAALAERGHEIMEAAERNGVPVFYSAAVGGGMDVLPRVDAMAWLEKILAIEAIINTTNNVILTRMAEEGMAYPDALRQAQEAGFAEADPALDVDGTDATQKLVLLV